MKGMGKKHREAMRKDFPPQTPTPEVYTTPLVIVDRHGKMISWYLPQVISMQRQVGTFALIQP